MHVFCKAVFKTWLCTYYLLSMIILEKIENKDLLSADYDRKYYEYDNVAKKRLQHATIMFPRRGSFKFFLIFF